MKVFPVVHIESPELAVEQASKALERNADGVYLINHNFDFNDVISAARTTLSTLERVHAEYPDSYVGVNLLGLSAVRAVRLIESYGGAGRTLPSGLWIDDIRTPEGLAPTRPVEIKNAQAKLRNMRILGGVAFKYTGTFTEDPTKAAQEAEALLDAVDVVTTSGAGTGTPPTKEKIAAMKAASGMKPLAVASGISLENMEEYVGPDGALIDEILVASSVETKPYSGIFDLAKLEAFIDKAHGLS